MLHYHPTEGAIGIGSFPLPLTPVLESIHFHYATRFLPTIEQSTHPLYTHTVHLPELRELLLLPLWNDLCLPDTNVSSCSIFPVEEMNELSVSHPSYAKERRYLYGAAANYEEHTDAPFRFPYARLYRVLIGLSNGNEHMETYFPAWKKGVFLNRGDYLVFDVDRTRHVVRRNTTSLRRPRFLLTFHFLAYDSTLHSPSTIYYLSRIYVYYDYITRWMLIIGTDPIAYDEYVMGWLIQLYISLYTVHVLMGTVYLSFLALRYSSYSLCAACMYSFLPPMVALLLLALGDWMTG